MIPVNAHKAVQIDKNYFDEERNRSLPTTIWLSSETEPRPLIIYSHGWNRDDSYPARYRKEWIRQILLNQGYNVCSVEHKDDNVHLLGRRAEDIAYVINQLRKDVLLNTTTPIGVMGFSKGGATCISAIGGRLRQLNVAEDAFTQELGVEHIEKINQYHKDKDFSIPEVKAAVLLQPGWLRRFDPQSLQHIAAKVLILDKVNEEGVERCFKDWASINKNVKKIDLPSNSHYILLDPPTELDKQTMPEDVYFMLFKEGMEGVDRKEVHHLSAEKIVKFFDEHLKNSS